MNIDVIIMSVYLFVGIFIVPGFLYIAACTDIEKLKSGCIEFNFITLEEFHYCTTNNPDCLAMFLLICILWPLLLLLWICYSILYPIPYLLWYCIYNPYYNFIMYFLNKVNGISIHFTTKKDV